MSFCIIYCVWQLIYNFHLARVLDICHKTKKTFNQDKENNY